MRDILENEFDEEIRLETAIILDDNEIINSLAKNSSDSNIREKAVKNVKNEDILGYIAKNDSDWSVRKEAVRNPNLTDISVLFDVLYDDPYSKVAEERDSYDHSSYYYYYPVREEAAVKITGSYEESLKYKSHWNQGYISVEDYMKGNY